MEVLKIKNPNGYGSVVNLGGNRRRPWGVRITSGWDDKGKQIYKYLGYFESRPDAMIALAEYNKNPYDINALKATFADVYELWDKEKFELSKQKTSEQLRRSYKSAYNNVEFLHNKVFIEIRAADMQKVIDDSKLGRSSKNNMKTLFGLMYKFVLKNDFPTRDYSTFVSVYAGDKPVKRKPFTNDEIKILWANADKFQSVEMALIMIYSGLRIGELLELKKEDVNIEERFLTGGLKTDAGKNRIVPLNKKIIPFLERRIESDSKHLFLNKIGGKLLYPAFMPHWKKELKKLKMNNDPHDCRHTFATLMDNANANKIAKKRIMGHSISDITDGVYTHKDLDQLLKAIDLI